MEETFYCCVPQYAVKSKTGDLQYNIHMPVCCGGCCLDLCAEGCCSCRIPFYIYPPGQHDTGTQVGKIVKVWGGIAKELFTDADTFELEVLNLTTKLVFVLFVCTLPRCTPLHSQYHILMLYICILCFF